MPESPTLFGPKRLKKKEHLFILKEAKVCLVNDSEVTFTEIF